MDNELHPMLQETVIEGRGQAKFNVHPSLQSDMDDEDVETIVDATEQEVQEAEAQGVLEQAPVVQEDAKQRQWREVRAQADSAKHLAREKEALERERDFYRQQAMNQQSIKEQDDQYLTDSEKLLRQQMEELRQQVTRQGKETEEAKRQAAVSRGEQRLTQDYPDIRQVVSDENIDRLKEEFPHLYRSAIASTDVYEVGSAAYEFIIAKGIYKKPRNPLNQIVSSTYKNVSKPRSASTVSPQSGESPIKQANSYMGNSISSEDERKAIYAEMLAASRSVRY